jgi:hypothetical protein
MFLYFWVTLSNKFKSLKSGIKLHPVFKQFLHLHYLDAIFLYAFVHPISNYLRKSRCFNDMVFREHDDNAYVGLFQISNGRGNHTNDIKIS